MEHSWWVEEDKLLDLNIGLPQQLKMVRVSAKIDEELKEQLMSSYKDVRYNDMKGISSKFHHQKIVLKDDTIACPHISNKDPL